MQTLVNKKKKKTEMVSSHQLSFLANFRALKLKITLLLFGLQPFLQNRNASLSEKKNIFSFVFCVYDIDGWQYFFQVKS